MTRSEHLVFCKKCLNRKFDFRQGLLCNLTGRIADFEEVCKDFTIDETVKEKFIDPPFETENEPMISSLDEMAINKLKVHQDFSFAFIGGGLVTLISAIIWAIVTVTAQFQIGYMAIGLGLLVGFSVRFFGAGIDEKFGYLGSFLSLFGCLLGNLFSQIGFIAQQQSLGYFETLTYLDFELILSILVESFSPMDLVFYAIAVYEGYKFSFRQPTGYELKQLQSEGYNGHPSNHKLRMPLVIVSIILIGFFLFTIGNGVNGVKTFQYESGKKMSEGEMVKSKEHGNWTYWYENGNTQLSGFYVYGVPDSLWQWFDESGKLSSIGNYKKGLEHGTWMNYYENGNLSDSGGYVEGRMDGLWKYWFENSNIYQIGYFKRNLQDSVWKTFNENGQISIEGDMKDGNPSGLWTTYYENGQFASKIRYLANKNALIEDAWDMEGNQLVVNGNGLYKSFANNGQLLLQGEIKDGKKVGKWVAYFENGNLNEEGNHKNEIYTIINSWNSKGEQTIKDGQGLYESYYPDNESIFETGRIESGLKEGKWETYYESSKSIYIENHYSKGVLTGIQKFYFESGQLYSSGEMKDGLKEGEWSWYYEDGDISSTAVFLNDKKEGIQFMWSETGEKTKEELYKNGELIEEKIL